MNAPRLQAKPGYIEIDVLAVARRVLGSTRNWSTVSVFELRAMAGFIDRYFSDPFTRGDQVDDIEIAMRVKAALDAHKALESARFSARESGARQDFERALKAISTLPEELLHD